MKNTLLHLSKPLPNKKAQLLSLLDHKFRDLAVDYLLVGAGARDLLMEHVYNIKSQRATTDVDFAICVADWNKYREVLTSLEADGYFAVSPTMTHRLKSSQYGVIDLIPFGDIERDNKIAWPPDFLTTMNLLGFSDAYRHSVKVKLSDHCHIPVVSLAGLATLKLIAWKDRGYQSKDISDLIFILLNYIDAGNYERLALEFSHFIDDDFDFLIMNSVMLGHDIRQLASRSCRQFLHKIFRASRVGLNSYLMTEIATRLIGYAEPFTQAEKMLNALNNALVGENVLYNVQNV